MTEKSNNNDPELDLRVGLVLHRFGHHLTPEQRAFVREGVVEEVTEVARELRAFKLDFTDEPLPLFAAYRRAGKE